MVQSILISCYVCVVKLIYQSKGWISLVHGLFEGAYYLMSELCAVYSRAQTKQGHEVIKEIR